MLLECEESSKRSRVWMKTNEEHGLDKLRGDPFDNRRCCGRLDFYNAKDSIRRDKSKVPVSKKYRFARIHDKDIDLPGSCGLGDNKTASDTNGLRQMPTQHLANHTLFPFSVSLPMRVLNQVSDAILQRFNFGCQRIEIGLRSHPSRDLALIGFLNRTLAGTPDISLPEMPWATSTSEAASQIDG